MAEQKSLAQVLKDINKKYGEGIVKQGADSLECDGVLSLGSPTVDFCLYGGLPEGRIIEFSGPEGGGKAQPLWSPVFTLNGYKRMGDLKVGDTVIDGKGNKTAITGIYDRGVLPCYKVSFNDGTSTICAEDHLWKVYNHAQGRKPIVEVLTVKQLLSRKLHDGCWAYSVDVPMIDIWEDEDIEIDPYLLGALIGDGSLSSDNFGFSNSEKDVISKVADLLKPLGLQLNKVPGDDNVDYDITLMDTAKYWYTYKGNTYKSLDQLKSCFSTNWANVYKYIDAYNKQDWELAAKYSSYCVGLTITENPCRKGRAMLYDFFSRNGLNCKSVNKSIPENYLYSSSETRMKLLQGLYDTDGYTSKSGNMEFNTSSEKLASQVAFLCRSLGFRVRVRKNSAPKYTYNGEVRYGAPTWVLTIKVPKGVFIGTS